MNGASRAALILVLVAGALGSGAASLCGGYYFVRTLVNEPAWLPMMAVFIVPSLLGGTALAVICIKQLRKVLKDTPPSPPNAPPP